MFDEQYVLDRLKEAAEVLKQLPQERVQGYFNSWPEIVRDAADMRHQPVPKRWRVAPLPEEISDMEDVLFNWMRWLEPEQRKITWWRAEKRRWKTIAWHFGCHTMTAQRRHKTAIKIIQSQLRERREQKLKKRQVPSAK